MQTTVQNQLPQSMSSQSNSEKSIADVLVAEKLITLDQLTKLKLEAARKNTVVDKLVHELQLVPEERYYEAQAKFLNVPFTSVTTLPFSPEALGFIPKSVAERFSLIPFAYDHDQKIISVVMSNTTDLEAIEFIKQKTGATIKVFQGIPSEITQAIQSQYSFLY